ncbi:MAG TPA: hypothetical protein VMG09_04780, partial [Bacteroidota bacterium]|nr:hypothetical protein [Bacteroidota bacterium]
MVIPSRLPDLPFCKMVKPIVVAMKLVVFEMFLVCFVVHAQSANPNLADPGSGCTVDSASSNAQLAYKVITASTEEGWNSAGETAGAWVKMKFSRATGIQEIWILARPIFSYVITPYNLQYRYNYTPARDIALVFSDGTTVNATLRQFDNFQIIRLPEQKRTAFLKVLIRDIWDGTGAAATGIGKIRVFANPSRLTFSLRSMENYSGVGNRPVKLAYLNVTNGGEELEDVHVLISQNGVPCDDIAAGHIEGHAVSERPIWTFIPSRDGEYDVALRSHGSDVAAPVRISMTAYRKTYFDGGVFLINSTNHNDLGWLGTQSETADYRSKEIILPALKIIEEHPEYRYTMEAVAYLREFLARHPEKQEELFSATREGKLSWGASYTLMLQEQVGPEKLARQFYYGRRWLRENVPGADSRIFINADVPMLTWQLPQILKSAGVKYLAQARIPLGFYYWQGLDGTTIPTYGLRYGNTTKLSPGANDEWLNLVYPREEYYRKHNLPRVMIYDYNEDYLPPNAAYIPFVNEQNEMTTRFAAAWNRSHAADKDQQVHPPLLRFTSPETMLDTIFGNPGIHLETLRGEWANNWAYYDDPGHRDALLDGRRGHNTLLAAERLFSMLKMIDPAVVYPKAVFDSAWEANCWPDHGWGGARGVITDSVYHASYGKSYQYARTLLHQATRILEDHLPRHGGRDITIAVYNPLNWKRREAVRADVAVPEAWKGFSLKAGDGTAVPFEIVDRMSDHAIILFNADVPGLAIALFSVEPSAAPVAESTPLAGDSVDTPEFKVVFGNAGISSYVDKIRNRSYFNSEKFQAGEL